MEKAFLQKKNSVSARRFYLVKPGTFLPSHTKLHSCTLHWGAEDTQYLTILCSSFLPPRKAHPETSCSLWGPCPIKEMTSWKRGAFSKGGNPHRAPKGFLPQKRSSIQSSAMGAVCGTDGLQPWEMLHCHSAHWWRRRAFSQGGNHPRALGRLLPWEKRPH